MGSRFHVPLLATREDVQLRALVDPRREAVERLADRYGVPRALTTVDDLHGTGVSAAVVAVPNNQHAPVSAALLERGIHVLVEKPLAPSAAAAELMVEAAQRADRVLAVVLPLRSSRASRLARDLVRRGELGDITEVRVEYSAAHGRLPVTDRRRQRETTGGGVLMDLGSHVLDLLLWWFGDLELTSYEDDGHGGIEADCMVRLTLPGGATCHVELSRTRDLAQLAVLHGERGTLEVGLGRNHLVLRMAATDGSLRGHAVRDPAEADHEESLADLISAVHSDFVAAVTRGTEPSVPAGEGMRSVALLEHCYAERRPLTTPWAGARPKGQTGSVVRAPTSDLHGTRVLVTGATGFIGGRVVEELVLTHGAEVRALARRPSTATRLLRFPVDVRWGTISDSTDVHDAVAGCDLVIHCAHDTASPFSNLRSGLQGTRNMVEAAMRAGVHRFVHLSSVVVYGETADGDLDEASAWGRSFDPYTLAKRRAERVVETAHEAGLPAVIIQPTKAYGPWGKRWTMTVASQMRTGAVPLIDGGHGLCNVVYIDDLVDAIILAATVPDAVGERFLVSAREPVTWRDFYAAFEEAVGERATVSVPSAALGPLARAQRSRLRRQLAGRALSGVRGILSDPDARAALRALPGVRLAMGVARDVAGPERWARLKTELVGRSSPPGRDQQRRLVHLPGTNVVASQRSRTRVRIDHAASVIGYEPRYALDDGMAATEAFLRWARLTGNADR